MTSQNESGIHENIDFTKRPITFHKCSDIVSLNTEPSIILKAFWLWPICIILVILFSKVFALPSYFLNDKFTFKRTHRHFYFILTWNWSLQPWMLLYLLNGGSVQKVVLQQLVDQVFELICELIWLVLNDVSSILVSLIYFIKRFRCSVHIVFQVLCVHISRFKRRKEIVNYNPKLIDGSDNNRKTFKDKLKEPMNLQ